LAMAAYSGLKSKDELASLDNLLASLICSWNLSMADLHVWPTYSILLLLTLLVTWITPLSENGQRLVEELRCFYLSLLSTEEKKGQMKDKAPNKTTSNTLHLPTMKTDSLV
jgi:hypothetical protein